MDNIDTKKLLFRVASEVVSVAKDLAPYKTGNLARDIQVLEVEETFATIGNTKLADYAKFVHEGTGIHGARKKRIKPKKGKALKTPFGFRKSVAGQKAQPYLTNALSEYANRGGLKRALDDFGDEANEDIIESFKKSINNHNITWS